jgi:hypothetical protein
VREYKSRTTEKEEFVYLPEEYKYSSVIDYVGRKGILVVEVIK